MTDVGTTKRRSMSPQRRLRIWEKHDGVCVRCGRKIDGTRERWIVEHIRALELGGADSDENCAPAHEECGIAKTREDHRAAAKAKRQKARHLGIKASGPKIPSRGFQKAPPQRRASSPISKPAAWRGNFGETDV